MGKTLCYCQAMCSVLIRSALSLTSIDNRPVCAQLLLLSVDTLNQNMIMRGRKERCWLFPTDTMVGIAASRYRLPVQVDNVNVNSLTLTLAACAPQSRWILSNILWDRCQRARPEEVAGPEVLALHSTQKSWKMHVGRLNSPTTV